MAAVVLDGEIVNFEGSPPSSSGEVWALIEAHLGQSGLLIDRFLVDGVLWTPEIDEPLEQYERIEVFSMAFERSVVKIAETLLKEGTQLLERWEMGASLSLSTPWTHFQSDGLEILNETQPLAQSIELLAEYSKQNELSWAVMIGNAREDFNTAMSSLMDAFEAGDCIAYSDLVVGELYPAIVGVYDLLSNEVVSSLGRKKSE